MKIYNKLTKEIRWEDDVSSFIDDIWYDVVEVLAQKRLDGHDEYDQWLMAVEHDLRHLRHTLAERDYNPFASKNEYIMD